MDETAWITLKQNVKGLNGMLQTVTFMTEIRKQQSGTGMDLTVLCVSDNDTRILGWNSKGHNCSVCGCGGNDNYTRTLGWDRTNMLIRFRWSTCCREKPTKQDQISVKRLDWKLMSPVSFLKSWHFLMRKLNKSMAMLTTVFGKAGT